MVYGLVGWARFTNQNQRNISISQTEAQLNRFPKYGEVVLATSSVHPGETGFALACNAKFEARAGAIEVVNGIITIWDARGAQPGSYLYFFDSTLDEGTNDDVVDPLIGKYW
jgi:hypothetical protein